MQNVKEVIWQLSKSEQGFNNSASHSCCNLIGQFSKTNKVLSDQCKVTSVKWQKYGATLCK